METLMRCKFQVHEVTEHFVGKNSPDGPMVKVRMGAVFETRTDGQQGNAVTENLIFGKYTPSGAFEATIRNPDICEALKKSVGRQVYLDFTFAD